MTETTRYERNKSADTLVKLIKSLWSTTEEMKALMDKRIQIVNLLSKVQMNIDEIKHHIETLRVKSKPESETILTSILHFISVNLSKEKVFAVFMGYSIKKKLDLVVEILYSTFQEIVKQIK